MPNVRVVVRCRPSNVLSPDGSTPSDSGHCAAPSPWSFHPHGIRLSTTSSQQQQQPPAGGGGGSNRGTPRLGGANAPGIEKAFQFNRVYALGETQESFFDAEVKPLLDAALGNRGCSTPVGTAAEAVEPQQLQGPPQSAPRHVVLFAYGQTGSGKTHTVDGQRAATSASVIGTSAPSATVTQMQNVDTQRTTTTSCDEDGIDESDNNDDASSSSSGDSTAICDDESSDLQQQQQQQKQRAGEGVAPRALRYVFNAWRNSPKSVGTSPPPRDGHMFRSSPSVTPNETGSFELVKVAVSFLEIYNEKLYDLLSASCRTGAGSPQQQLEKNSKNNKRRAKGPSTVEALAAMHATSLRLRRCPDALSHGPAKFEVENLTKLSCITVEEALEYYYYAVSKKIFRAHNLNSQSSRAHSIFTIYLTFRDLSSAGGGTAATTTAAAPGGAPAFDATLGGGVLDQASLVTSEIAIVDLAGSERLHSILPQDHSNIAASSTLSSSQQRPPPPASPRHTSGGSALSGSTQKQRPSSGPVGGNVYLDGIRKQQQQAALITESIYINKSLLTLGKVIMALSSGAKHGDEAQTEMPPQPPTTPLTPSSRGNYRGGGAAARSATTCGGNASTITGSRRHTPFRDSKLTMVMNHALGGNAITVMVACIHTDSSQVHESLSTLFYATRTNRIANVVVSLEDPKTQRIKLLLAEVQRLKGELQASHETIENLSTLLTAQRRSPHDNICSSSKGSHIGIRVEAAELLLPAPDAPGVKRTTTREGDDTRELSSGDASCSRSVENATTSPAGPPASDMPTQIESIQHSGGADPRGDHATNAEALAETLSAKLHEACMKLKMVLDANARLRTAFDGERQRTLAVERDQERLLDENLRLREKLDLYDSLLLAQIAINRKYDSHDGPAAATRNAGGQTPRALHRSTNLEASAAGIESMTSRFFEQQKKQLIRNPKHLNASSTLSPRLINKSNTKRRATPPHARALQEVRSYETHETLRLTSTWDAAGPTPTATGHSSRREPLQVQLQPSPPPPLPEQSTTRAPNQGQFVARPSSATSVKVSAATTSTGGSFQSGLPLHLLLGGASPRSRPDAHPNM
jgi:hypothetical protein